MKKNILFSRLEIQGKPGVVEAAVHSELCYASAVYKSSRTPVGAIQIVSIRKSVEYVICTNTNPKAVFTTGHFLV